MVVSIIFLTWHHRLVLYLLLRCSTYTKGHFGFWHQSSKIHYHTDILLVQQPYYTFTMVSCFFFYSHCFHCLSLVIYTFSRIIREAIDCLKDFLVVLLAAVYTTGYHEHWLLIYTSWDVMIGSSIWWSILCRRCCCSWQNGWLLYWWLRYRWRHSSLQWWYWRR